MERSVIAPPPELQAKSRETLQAPQSDVIAPPPTVDAAATRRLGDLNIGHASVIAPAPQLSLDEQRAPSRRNTTALGKRSPEVIAPPPALGAAGASAGSGKESAGGSGKKSSGDLPAGLYVGKASNAPSPVAGDPATKNSSAYAVNPNLIAHARPARVSAQPMQPASESKLSQEERAVFGNRKFYSLSLNMPNLNSAGGSWIIRFAQLKPDASAGSTSAGVASSAATSSAEPAADLSAPSATRKVDPAYPLELMRQNVGGTVILYGVIHADGTVGNVRVLRSADDRLDQFASDAIAKWQFQPATKNGAPVDVEATFWIPFRPPKF
jgi:TonB family protein